MVRVRVSDRVRVSQSALDSQIRRFGQAQILHVRQTRNWRPDDAVRISVSSMINAFIKMNRQSRRHRSCRIIRRRVAQISKLSIRLHETQATKQNVNNVNK